MARAAAVVVLCLPLAACGGSSKKHATPAFAHVQAAEIAVLRAHPNHKHHLRVSCTPTACTVALHLRDRPRTVVATDHWSVDGKTAALQGTSAIQRWLTADGRLGCTRRYFAAIKAAGHPAPGVGAERAALQRALAPCRSAA
jgi:hypothetical protein